MLWATSVGQFDKVFCFQSLLALSRNAAFSIALTAVIGADNRGPPVIRHAFAAANDIYVCPSAVIWMPQF